MCFEGKHRKIYTGLRNKIPFRPVTPSARMQGCELKVYYIEEVGKILEDDHFTEKLLFEGLDFNIFDPRTFCTHFWHRSFCSMDIPWFSRKEWICSLFFRVWKAR